MVNVIVFSLPPSSDRALVVILVGIVAIVLIIVSLATSVKRWHNRDKSGLWIFISLVPVIGSFWALIETGFLSGTEDPNRYGAASSGSPFEG